MMFKKLALGASVAASVLMAGFAAKAQDAINFVHNTYRTGAFSGSGIPVGDGVRDYFAMLNARDGGIGGVRINFEECETAYDTRRSVECYEQGKAKNSVLYVPWSTGATLAAIPRAHIDKIPIFSAVAPVIAMPMAGSPNFRMVGSATMKPAPRNEPIIEPAPPMITANRIRKDSRMANSVPASAPPR